MADISIVLLYRDVFGDVVYWAGWTKGHDGQGWTADRGEALTFASFSAANLERRVAWRYHPTRFIESDAQDIVSDDETTEVASG